MSPTWSQRGARKIATTAAASARTVTADRAAASLDTSHHRPAQEPRRTDEEDDQDDEERDRQAQAVELDVQVTVVGDDQVQHHADREPAAFAPTGLSNPPSTAAAK